MSELNKIIEDCQNNKRRAQQQLYNMFAPKMLGVCMRYCKSRSEAEDCLQEGFIKVFSKIHLFGFKGSFEGWIRRIIVNTVIEFYRKKQPEILVDEFPIITEYEEEVFVPVVSQQELLAMIQELPPKYRLVFNMYAIEGFSHQEIAEEMNISIGTSKSNLSRARQWLKQKIEEKVKGKKQGVC
ncbi:RNA polymerase sigma factor [Carboxylicivirga caseinilyticus]|uniref:RNA polymerase sigma factor n=1 Tax=Carboxylicivirga caseinilyticus TaxID=3417572 RepID=UPI003D33A210